MNLVKTLISEGHEVITIAPHDEYTHYLEDAGCTHHDLKMDSRGANPIKDFLLIFELFSVYRRHKPDVILHFTVKPNVYGTLAAAMLNIPSINNVCGLGTIFLKKGIVSQVAIGLYRLAFLFPKKVFFQNPDDRSIFLEKRLISKGKCDLLPGSGIDLEKFEKVSFKRNSPFTFLMISRIIKDKGVNEFIDAIRVLRSKGVNARFQILGAKDPHHKRGIAVEKIQEWINGGVIEYLGKAKDVRPYIQNADCVVLPSYREGTPRTLLEAAGMAKPIVTTDVPGCHHVVENGVNGLLCRMKDANDLAAKMEAMTSLSDEELKTMGENGRRKIEREFDEQIVINKYLLSIKQVVPVIEFSDKKINEKIVISRN
jgi:glycosyltransferase involved in cell wall biosynthesis